MSSVRGEVAVVTGAASGIGRQQALELARRGAVVEAGRPRILVGNDARAVDLLVRLAPRPYPELVARVESRLSRTA